MVTIKGTGFTIKRDRLSMFDSLSILNDLCDANIISGYDIDTNRDGETMDIVITIHNINREGVR